MRSEQVLSWKLVIPMTGVDPPLCNSGIVGIEEDPHQLPLSLIVVITPEPSILNPKTLNLNLISSLTVTITGWGVHLTYDIVCHCGIGKDLCLCGTLYISWVYAPLWYRSFHFFHYPHKMFRLLLYIDPSIIW